MGLFFFYFFFFIAHVLLFGVIPSWETLVALILIGYYCGAPPHFSICAEPFGAFGGSPRPHGEIGTFWCGISHRL